MANLIFVIYYVMFDFRKNTKETIYIYIYIYFEENNFLMFFFCFFMENTKQNKVLFKLINNFIF